jgi:hypothetical protein
MKPTVAIAGIGIITPWFDHIGGMAAHCASCKFPDKKEIAQIKLPADIKLQDQRRMAKISRLALYAADAAMASAHCKGRDAALFIGLTHSSGSLLREFHDYLFDYGPEMTSPNAFSNGVTGAALGVVSKYLGLTLGGATFVGYENGGFDVLNTAARAMADGRYPRCCVGATEEYSAVVEEAYARFGWYHGIAPAALPCPLSNQKAGYAMIEASVFLVCEPAGSPPDGPYCYYAPIDTPQTFDGTIDLVISNAGGGPQDGYELSALSAILAKQKKPLPVLFSQCFFGEAFAAGPLLSTAMGWDMLIHNASYPAYPVHQDLKSNTRPAPSNTEINAIMILSASRTGDITAGILSRNPL